MSDPVFNSGITLPKLSPSKEEQDALRLQEQTFGAAYSDQAVSERVLKIEAEAVTLRAMRNQDPTSEAAESVTCMQEAQARLESAQAQLKALRERAEHS